MPTPDQRTQIDETDAKAATNNGVVRWVLVISLALAVAALTVIWMTGAFSQDPVESEVNVQRKQEAASATKNRTEAYPLCAFKEIPRKRLAREQYVAPCFD